MWHRKCRVIKEDPFVIILEEINKLYNEHSWRSIAEMFSAESTTHKKMRRNLSRELSVVGLQT